MNKKKIFLESWYIELPDLIKEEMKGKIIKIILFGDDSQFTVKVDSFFKDLVVSRGDNKSKDKLLICGIVDQNSKRYNFIQIKSIETENFQFTKIIL